MIDSVRAIQDKDLTPLAAVAGTLADAVADFLVQCGMTRAVVNNGGDIAVRSHDGQPVRVGVKANVEHPEGDHILQIGAEENSFGIATSGLGGRSLTRGIASAVTVLGRRASIADAAATSLANATYVEDPEVHRVPAEKKDPWTDIRGTPVTLRVGRLGEKTIIKALDLAMERASSLENRGLILGALITVQGKVAMTDTFRDRLQKDT
jgi:ApbE superfamily uncharacterized protein (UPF0280 family)